MKTKKFTKANFKKWLLAQKPTRKFRYLDNTGCLFASFAKEAMGLEEVWCGGFHLEYKGVGDHAFPLWARDLNHSIQSTEPFTVKDVISLL